MNTARSAGVYSPNGKNCYYINYMDDKVNYVTIEVVTSFEKPKFHVREDTGDLQQLIDLLVKAQEDMRSQQ